MYGFLNANVQVASYMGYNLLTCPYGYLIQGYDGRADASGISYFDVSPCCVLDVAAQCSISLLFLE